MLTVTFDEDGTGKRGSRLREARGTLKAVELGTDKWPFWMLGMVFDGWFIRKRMGRMSHLVDERWGEERDTRS